MKLAKLKAFAVFDSKIESWHPPMFFQHTGQAERTWMELCRDTQSMLNKHEADYVLYQIGEFNDDTGILTSITPVQVMTAVAAKQVRSNDVNLSTYGG